MHLGQHHPGCEGAEGLSFALTLSKREAEKGKGLRAVKASRVTGQILRLTDFSYALKTSGFWHTSCLKAGQLKIKTQ